MGGGAGQLGARRGVIVGTAGHIDHGKTALVRALTGVDTDRLPEEKRRGITIELGFAPLPLDGVGIAGVVDVPGHEAFVRTMVAGATGVDLALLVVAADEGVMPQTREHLAILGLLGVPTGVVAVTKADLVDDEWLALVLDDVRAALAGSPLESAPIVPTSVRTTSGLEPLRAALAAAARSITPRDDDDLFRMPVDRVFTVRGTGTVVTGTVWSGTLRRDAAVRLLPSGRTARVRTLQSHGRAVDALGSATRGAVALAGVEVGEVERGTVLVTGAAWEATRSFRADLHLLGDAAARLRARTRVSLHLGTSEVRGRVVLAAGGEPGRARAARIVVDAPLVARGGDRFILRSLSPVATIGGGTIVDPLPTHRRARPWPDVAGSPERLLAAILDEAGARGVAIDRLPVRLGLPPAGVRRLLDDAAETVVRVADVVTGRRSLAVLGATLLATLDALQAEAPLDPAIPLQALRARLDAPRPLVDGLVRAAVDRGEVVVDGGSVRRAGWSPSLTAEQALVLAELERRLAAAGREPPSVQELAGELGPDVPTLVGVSERAGRVRLVEAGRYYDRGVLDDLVNLLSTRLEPGREYAPSELREVIGVSRKYLIPLLEFLDREGLTERTETGRRWRGTFEPRPGFK